jgi:hypothetical protein
MPSPSSEASRRIHVYGHVSGGPQAIASEFGGIISSSPAHDSDLAIFVINPAAGIDAHTIELWAALDEIQIPRLVLVNGLDGQELDFEDAVMVANRVFDQLVTPYLVLHHDDGSPAALIRLEDLHIIDYATTPASVRPCDLEHEELVKEFREEFLEQVQEMDDGAFAAGILFPAIPINLTNGIGVDIVHNYIKALPSSG